MLFALSLAHFTEPAIEHPAFPSQIRRDAAQPRPGISALPPPMQQVLIHEFFYGGRDPNCALLDLIDIL
jgi:hypothetical protein